jgi:hypothetical protein
MRKAGAVISKRNRELLERAISHHQAASNLISEVLASDDASDERAVATVDALMAQIHRTLR